MGLEVSKEFCGQDWSSLHAHTHWSQAKEPYVLSIFPVVVVVVFWLWNTVSSESARQAMPFNYLHTILFTLLFAHVWLCASNTLVMYSLHYTVNQRSYNCDIDVSGAGGLTAVSCLRPKSLLQSFISGTSVSCLKSNSLNCASCE